MIPFACRNARPTDLPYIVSTWVQSDSKTMRARECGKVHGYEHRAIVAKILQRPITISKVAHLKEDEDAIIGWAAFELNETPILHYVYVRDGVRHCGIAHALLEDFPLDAAIEFTHKPPMQFGGITHPVPGDWTFNPYRAY